MRLFFIELKRSVINKNMLIALLIGVLIVMPHTINNYLGEIEYKEYISNMNISSGADLTSLYGRWFGMSTGFSAIFVSCTSFFLLRPNRTR